MMGYNPKLDADDFTPLTFTLRGNEHPHGKVHARKSIPGHQWDNDGLCPLWDEELEAMHRDITNFINFDSLNPSKLERKIVKELIRQLRSARKDDSTDAESKAFRNAFEEVLGEKHREKVREILPVSHWWKRRGNNKKRRTLGPPRYLLEEVRKALDPKKSEEANRNFERTEKENKQRRKEHASKQSKRAPQFGGSRSRSGRHAAKARDNEKRRKSLDSSQPPP